jgi:hypothetical protein
VAQLEDRADHQQLAVSTAYLQGSSSPFLPIALPLLTGLLELLLVIVQGLVVMHADPAHLDPQLLRNWLLAVGQGQ